MAKHCRANMVVQIIYDKKIEQPVVVIVEPAGSHRPRLTGSRGSGDGCFQRHVGECTVAIIMQELIDVYSRNVKIIKTIVVVVSNGNTHGIANPFEPRSFGNIGKCSITVVAK